MVKPETNSSLIINVGYLFRWNNILHKISNSESQQSRTDTRGHSQEVCDIYRCLNLPIFSSFQRGVEAIILPR